MVPKQIMRGENNLFGQVFAMWPEVNNGGGVRRNRRRKFTPKSRLILPIDNRIVPAKSRTRHVPSWNIASLNSEPDMLTEVKSTNESTTGSAAAECRTKESQPIRLWLVDDNDRLRNTVAELLARTQGVECTRSFSSATELLSALASKVGPDVILLDIQMGEENGLDAVRPIKSLARDTRVFMFTTMDDHKWRKRALEDGASGFLLKRCPIEEIVETIRKPCESGEQTTPRRRRQNRKTEHVKLSHERRANDLGAASAVRPSEGKRSDVFNRCLRILRDFWN